VRPRGRGRGLDDPGDVRCRDGRALPGDRVSPRVAAGGGAARRYGGERRDPLPAPRPLVAQRDGPRRGILLRRPPPVVGGPAAGAVVTACSKPGARRHRLGTPGRPGGPPRRTAGPPRPGREEGLRCGAGPRRDHQTGRRRLRAAGRRPAGPGGRMAGNPAAHPQPSGLARGRRRFGVLTSTALAWDAQTVTWTAADRGRPVT